MSELLQISRDGARGRSAEGSREGRMHARKAANIKKIGRSEGTV